MIRRIFRIWPLFFLVVITVFLLPDTLKDSLGLNLHIHGYEVDGRFSFTFLENYKMILEDDFPNTNPLQVFWTLCVEEHFYLLWLVILGFFSFKKIIYFFIITIPIAWAARIGYRLVLDNNLEAQDVFTNLDYFGCGAILAFGLVNHSQWLSEKINSIAIYWKLAYVFLAIAFLIVQQIILPDYFFKGLSIIKPTLTAILLTCILACFIPVNSKLKLTHPILNYLGRISYGLYVYHMVVINFVYQYLINKGILLAEWKILISFIFITLSATILISILSFHFFEKPFLSLREQLTR
jgi:peptidoglycan/LPS O-acetylase OafA/YrhL